MVLYQKLTSKNSVSKNFWFKRMIIVIDYGAGNVRSVMNMLKALGAKARIAVDGDGIKGAERLILPGVGHFDYGMAQLEERGLVEPLNYMVLRERVPILGICLGAQLLARNSEEGTRAGLGWVAADVVAFDRKRMGNHLRVPHMGWAETWVHAPSLGQGRLAKPIAATLETESRFYYVHSYHLLCDIPDAAVMRAHHGYEFAAGVAEDNILGVQFHPEKSHAYGKSLLKAFLNWQPEFSK
jgi:glutamine amidotransferase